MHMAAFDRRAPFSNRPGWHAESTVLQANELPAVAKHSGSTVAMAVTLLLCCCCRVCCRLLSR